MKAAIICGLVIFASARLSQAEEAIWQSRAQTPARLSQELETLYLGLFNSGNLQVRPVVMQLPYGEVTMRAEGAWPGAGMPVAIDAMLCDLNPAICTRDRVAAGPDVLTSDTGHLRGTLATPGRWTANAGDVLNMPAYQFRKVTTLARIPAPPRWTPEAVTRDPDLDCSGWGASCAEVARRLNPKAFNAPKDWGTSELTVPVIRLETVISLAPSQDQPSAPPPTAPEAVPMTPPPIAPPLSPMRSTFVVDWQPSAVAPDGMPAVPVANHADPAPDPVIPNELRRNLRPKAEMRNYGGRAGVIRDEQKALFASINHPYARGQDLPENARAPVVVVVADTRPAHGHCGLSNIHVWESGALIELPPLADRAGVLPDAPGASPAPVGGGSLPGRDQPYCANLPISDLPDPSDHPIGIGGIIAARAEAGGISGMNPYARLVYLGLDDRHLGTLVDRLARLPTHARVVNISRGTPADSEFGLQDMKKRLADYEHSVLFVAAAGNEGRDLSDLCNITPACELKLDNVITVVGLDQDADLWKSDLESSNFHRDFDIAAIASPVLTTAPDNAVGWRQGTSYAAPQVTAAASMVIAAAQTAYIEDEDAVIPPKIIRDRLVYTADYLRRHEGKVRGGRLNVARALDINRVQVVLRDGKTYSGQIQKSPDRYTCWSEDGENDQQGYSWYWVRRVMFNESQGQWRLWRNRGAISRDQIVEGARYTDLDLTGWCILAATDGKGFQMMLDDGREVTFALTEVADYTSRLFSASGRLE